MQFKFLKYLKFYYLFAGALALGAIVCLLFFGLNFGIDFLGGSMLEVVFEERPENAIIQEKLGNLGLGEVIIQPSGEKGVIIKMKEIDESTHQKIIAQLQEISKIEERQFESIGPAVGKELREKTLVLIAISLVALLLYVAISFRKVSRPISSWQYGIISIATLAFDVLVTIGVFSLLGKFSKVQFSIPIVTALLTILGYTINDKVIVFDRVRENLLKTRQTDLCVLVEQSLNQTLTRSLGTGFCTLLVLFAILFFGGSTLTYFALTLILGIVVGTYSSLFLAAPLLVSYQRFKERRFRKK